MRSSGPDTLNDGGHADQEVVLLLFALDALIKVLLDLFQAANKGVLRAGRHLVPHEDSELIDLLPLVLEGQESADLEMASPRRCYRR